MKMTAEALAILINHAMETRFFDLPLNVQQAVTRAQLVLEDMGVEVEEPECLSD